MKFGLREEGGEFFGYGRWVGRAVGPDEDQRRVRQGLEGVSVGEVGRGASSEERGKLRLGDVRVAAGSVPRSLTGSAGIGGGGWLAPASTSAATPERSTGSATAFEDYMVEDADQVVG